MFVPLEMPSLSFLFCGHLLSLFLCVPAMEEKEEREDSSADLFDLWFQSVSLNGLKDSSRTKDRDKIA